MGLEQGNQWRGACCFWQQVDEGGKQNQVAEQGLLSPMWNNPRGGGRGMGKQAVGPASDGTVSLHGEGVPRGV